MVGQHAQLIDWGMKQCESIRLDDSCRKDVEERCLTLFRQIPCLDLVERFKSVGLHAESGDGFFHISLMQKRGGGQVAIRATFERLSVADFGPVFDQSLMLMGQMYGKFESLRLRPSAVGLTNIWGDQELSQCLVNRAANACEILLAVQAEVKPPSCGNLQFQPVVVFS